MADDIQADVVIVGAGIAGSLVGSKLAASGAKVVMLESGPWVDRSAGVEWYRKALAKTPESPYPDLPYAPRPKVIDPKGYLVQDGPDLFKSTYERRVGGTTWHWLGTTLRELPNDLRLHGQYGVGQDWPLAYEDLESWYVRAETELGVSGDSTQDLGSPRSADYPNPAIAMTYLDKQIAAAAASLRLQVQSTPQARNSRPYDGRPACCGNSVCVPMCPIGAKYDGAVHATKAQKSGAQIIDRAIASFVEVQADGSVGGIRFKRPDQTEQRAFGKIYVIAAHAIETPKLLLMSRADAVPNGVCNSSDQVGRNLMDHPTQLSWALANAPLYPYRGPLATSGIEQLRDGDFRRRRAAFRIEIGNDGWSWPGGAPVDLAGTLIKQGHHGADLAAAIKAQIPLQFRLASLLEQLPDPDNRVSLAPNQVDALGLPRPRVHYKVDEYALAGMAEARRVHDQLFDAIGVSFRQHRDEFEGAGHIMGTYRMGADPKTSVVNGDQRSHDHPNLFLLGSGAFPSSGTANPTLTIAALALRAAATIQQELGR
jgi:choline dehydrogenase-like flavoprotein